ncbi:MAG: mechanosensitive ion channel family protein [Verrucomicrobia bacterium]|nr:mechanosensitive ion channel family protein [Verrucomicrobiota bacterium]
MKRIFRLWFATLTLLMSTLGAVAQPAKTTDVAEVARTALVATGATGQADVRTPDLLEHIVDVFLRFFNVTSSGNTATHYVISAVFIVGAILLRRFLTTIFFNQLKKLASKTETTLDDKLFPAMESPVATFVMVTGIFAALKVLKLSETADHSIAAGSTVAFSLVTFWGLLRAFDAIIDHAAEIAKVKQMGIAAFMPWIKKSLIAVFVVVGTLMTVQSLGYNVSTILQGLGIGGLAFALAAQDTIANLFGSLVVAIDQPFKIGETVKIGAHTGTVEDIGLRSTKIRLLDKSLVVMPNKLVSSEAIVNLSRFTQRRVEQVIGLTYDTTPDQLAMIVEDFRGILLAEPEIDPTSVMVFFRDLSASSLDVWVVYASRGADLKEGFALKQRMNLAIMRAVAARRLSFAYPTSVMHLEGPVAKALVGGKG